LFERIFCAHRDEYGNDPWELLADPDLPISPQAMEVLNTVKKVLKSHAWHREAMYKDLPNRQLFAIPEPHPKIQED
jgi:hypothetical protein